MLPGIAGLFRPSVTIHEDEDCRSTKEFRMELVRPRRTWRERFVDGPVWAPKPEFKPERMMEMGVPVAYKLADSLRLSRGLTIIAHPEIAMKMRAELAKAASAYPSSHQK
jgi:hypothetical protein